MLPGLQTQVRITRAEFEATIRPVLHETTAMLKRALEVAGVTAGDLSAVVLAGGSSRIPLVAEMVSEALGRSVSVDSHPKDTVALGAARLAATGDRGTTRESRRRRLRHRRRRRRTAVDAATDAGNRPGDRRRLPPTGHASAGPCPHGAGGGHRGRSATPAHGPGDAANDASARATAQARQGVAIAAASSSSPRSERAPSCSSAATTEVTQPPTPPRTSCRRRAGRPATRRATRTSRQSRGRSDRGPAIRT